MGIGGGETCISSEKRKLYAVGPLPNEVYFRFSEFGRAAGLYNCQKDGQNKIGWFSFGRHVAPKLLMS